MLSTREKAYIKFIEEDRSVDEIHEFYKDWALTGPPPYDEILDPRVLPFVKALQSAGFPTIGSCSGHGKRGFVSLLSREGEYKLTSKDKRDIREIASTLGVRNLKFEFHDEALSIVRFSSLDN